jgi:hypothetical protein
MSEGPGRVADKACRRRPWRVVGMVTPAIFVVLAASPGTTDADSQRHSVFARLDGNSARGRYKVSVSSKRIERLEVQKAIVNP